MLRDQPPRPANMENVVAINQGRKPYSLAPVRVPFLPSEEAAALVRAGHLVLDSRHREAYSEGHVEGAYNVELDSGGFEQHVGWIMPPDQPFLLVAERREHVPAAVRKLAFVGLDRRVPGAIDPDAWRDAGMPVERLPQVGVQDLDREIRRGDLRVLDVREASEWASGYIESAVHMSFKLLPTRLGDLAVTPEDRIAVVCGSGTRSSTACSVLTRAGFRRVCNVSGGMNAWRSAGLPVVRPGAP